MKNYVCISLKEEKCSREYFSLFLCWRDHTVCAGPQHLYPEAQWAVARASRACRDVGDYEPAMLKESKVTDATGQAVEMQVVKNKENATLSPKGNPAIVCAGHVGSSRADFSEIPPAK
jgi:hypothetical protein